MRYGVRKLALLLLMLAAPAAHAQLWRGPAAVEVRVEDRGNPVAGAELQLRYNGVDPKDGPPALTTDSRGRANISGLAPGSWQVEVRREGFMTYLAEIEVREAGRPELVQATQVKVAGASRTLDVRISKGRPAPEARAAAPARPPVQETPPPAPARTQPAPAPRTEPVTPPRQPEPRPTPPPQPAPREQPPVPAPQTAPQQPAPAPAPPAQTVQPTPPPVAAPAVDSVRLRTAQDRTCVECQPGESSLSLERVIPPGGGPGCGTDLSTLLRGNLSGLPAGCDVLQIDLPEGTRYIGYRFEVQDGNESLDCPTGKDCPGSLGRWPADPIVIRGPQKTIVRAAFESGQAARERRAVLTVYYKTASGKR